MFDRLPKHQRVERCCPDISMADLDDPECERVHRLPQISVIFRVWPGESAFSDGLMAEISRINRAPTALFPPGDGSRSGKVLHDVCRPPDLDNAVFHCHKTLFLK